MILKVYASGHLIVWLSYHSERVWEGQSLRSKNRPKRSLLVPKCSTLFYLLILLEFIISRGQITSRKYRAIIRATFK